MEAGCEMYLDLQKMYKSSDAADFDDTIYESAEHIGPIKHGMVRIEEGKLEQNLQDPEDVYDNVDIKTPVFQKSHTASEDDEIYACISDEVENDAGSSSSSNSRLLQNPTVSSPPSVHSHTILPGNEHSVENADNLITDNESKTENGLTETEENLEIDYDIVEF